MVMIGTCNKICWVWMTLPANLAIHLCLHDELHSTTLKVRHVLLTGSPFLVVQTLPFAYFFFQTSQIYRMCFYINMSWMRSIFTFVPSKSRKMPFNLTLHRFPASYIENKICNNHFLLPLPSSKRLIEFKINCFAMLFQSKNGQSLQSAQFFSSICGWRHFC